MENKYVIWLNKEIEYYKEKIQKGSDKRIMIRYKSKLTAYLQALVRYKSLGENK